MSRKITVVCAVGHVRQYLIRGRWTAKELRTQYAVYLKRNEDKSSAMPFHKWLVYAGKVHSSKREYK